MARFWAGINPWLRLTGGIVLAGVVLSLAWYLGAPILFDQRVDEAFPVSSSQSTGRSDTGASAANKPASEPMGQPADPTASEPMEQPSDKMVGQLAEPTASEPMEQPSDKMVGQPADPTASEPMEQPSDKMVGQPADPTTSEPMEQPTRAAVQPTTQPTVAAATAVPTPEARTEPVVLRTGSFGAMGDGVHEGEGRATLYELPDGARLLRLEDFNVTNGPDLRVYLSADPSPRDADALVSGDSVEIAPLKGNIGNQNYDIPAELDPARFRSVVIYCKRFHVLVSIASFEG
ncbi:MAG TPA: DM13 domain-containing protein [Roseiflexaceae bacterium]|nr:DM13 domain-containing protein [Roseiflexaceae bacterium]